MSVQMIRLLLDLGGIAIGYVLMSLLPGWRSFIPAAIVVGTLMAGIILGLFGVPTPLIYILFGFPLLLPVVVGAFGGLIVRAITLSQKGISRGRRWAFTVLGLVLFMGVPWVL